MVFERKEKSVVLSKLAITNHFKRVASLYTIHHEQWLIYLTGSNINRDKTLKCNKETNIKK